MLPIYTAEMDAERVRALLMKLPHVAETVQWGGKLVFWVGDKTIGGKMFAVVDLDGPGRAVISWAAGSERYTELLEIDGLFPAPYMARIYWVAAERWSVFRASEWEHQLRAAYEPTLAKLPTKTRVALEIQKETTHSKGQIRRKGDAKKRTKVRGYNTSVTLICGKP